MNTFGNTNETQHLMSKKGNEDIMESVRIIEMKLEYRFWKKSLFNEWDLLQCFPEVREEIEFQ